MKFGICTPVENGALLRSYGWDYVEPSVQDLLQGTTDDSQWNGRSRMSASGLPTYAANMLVPAHLKVTGPDVHLGTLQDYITRVVLRASMLGMRVLVFGSGGARAVPEGFSHVAARDQIIAFLKMAGAAAAIRDVTIVIEPLNKGECNILNSYAEAVEVCRAVNHRNIRCLVDSYHLWLENEPLENVANNADVLMHVHLADKEGRVPPGKSGKSDYRPLFALLKKIHYTGGISVESMPWPDMPTNAGSILGYLKEEWEKAG